MIRDKVYPKADRLYYAPSRKKKQKGLTPFLMVSQNGGDPKPVHVKTIPVISVRNTLKSQPQAELVASNEEKAEERRIEALKPKARKKKAKYGDR